MKESDSAGVSKISACDKKEASLKNFFGSIILQILFSIMPSNQVALPK